MKKELIALGLVGALSIGMVGCNSLLSEKVDLTKGAAIRYLVDTEVEKRYDEIKEFEKEGYEIEKVPTTSKEIEQFAKESQVMVTAMSNLKEEKGNNEKSKFIKKLATIDYNERQINKEIVDDLIDIVVDKGTNSHIILTVNEYEIIYIIEICKMYMMENKDEDSKYAETKKALNSVKKEIEDFIAEK